MATSLLSLIPLLLLLHCSIPTQAQTPTAAAPAPTGPVNITGILDKGGQYTTFMRLLNTTQVGNQLENQLNNSNQGLTIFAPTDNAFNNLKSGTINDLTVQQQVELVLYHVLPQFYTLSNLLLVSNPVRTQATGQDGGDFGLNFTGQNNQVNVSTGIVVTPVNNYLYMTSPLAIYEVDKVLLPEEIFGAKSPTPAPAPQTKTTSTASNTTVTASQPSPASGANGKKIALGLVGWLWLLCIGVLSF